MIIQLVRNFLFACKMPELPEVEITRRSFHSAIAGARVLALELGKPLRWPIDIGFEGGVAQVRSELLGARVLGVRRRGKYLLMDLQRSEVSQNETKAALLMLHLGMSGSLRFEKNLRPAGTHDHFTLRTDRGDLRLHDPRRFGAVIYAHSENDSWPRKLLGTLGVEPLENSFTPAMFYAALKKRQAPIKQVLLAGDIVVGVGNIYASEALFIAKIRPTRAACKLSAAAAMRLHAAIVQVLQAALEAGGSTLKDFQNARGESGYFQLQAQVYGRAGEACRVCGGAIKMIRQGQRSSFYCPACQK